MKKNEQKNKDTKNKIKRGVTTILIITLILVGTFFSLYLYINNEKGQNFNINDDTVQSDSVLEDLEIDIDGDGKKDKDVIGSITINSINLIKAPIKEGTDMTTLNEYIGHFPSTSILEGNVAFCGHNRGYLKNYFENLKNVSLGDEIIYETKYETKIYKISEVKKVQETDVSVLQASKDNKITLITCVENEPELRLCVVGTQK